MVTIAIEQSIFRSEDSNETCIAIAIGTNHAHMRILSRKWRHMSRSKQASKQAN